MSKSRQIESLPKVLQEDAALLREGLSHIYNNFPHTQLRGKVILILKEYGEKVIEYCEHPQSAAKNDGNEVCLDCGTPVVKS